MICQQCGKRPATTIYAEIVSDKKTVYHLCQECVAKKKGTETLSDISFSIATLLTEWLKSEESLGEVIDLECEECGLSYAEFREHVRLGCAGCYDAFSGELDGLLEKIQGDNRHRGKTKPPRPAGALPTKEAAVPDLNEALRRAVEREEFEQAAKLRDEIARTKKQTKKKPQPQKGPPPSKGAK